MSSLLTWDEVKKELNGDCTVLLGNGFSRSYCNKSFDQKEILSRMDSLSGLANIVDIEKCIKDTQSKIQDILPETTVPKSIINGWIKKQLHKEFISTLYDLMPKSLNDIEDFNEDKVLLYRQFFNKFDKVFTLNYDPLLYWMLMKFINYGNEEYVNYSNLSEDLKNIEKNTKEYESLKKKVDKSNEKCLKTVRTEMYEKYLEDKDYYKMTLSCKDEILIEKTLKEAQKQFLIKWDKLSDNLYHALEENKDENATLKEESENLDNIANSTLEKKLQEVETNKQALKIQINDGFNSEIWSPNMNQTIFYLHGAFHIMNNGTDILKVKAEESNKMVDKIKKKWEEGFEPLTVLESSPEDKLNRIQQSQYLTKCFNELKNISGTLVTHGLSFMHSDQHIIDAINENSKLEKIYIGVWERISDDIKNAFQNNDKVIFFNTNGMF